MIRSSESGACVSDGSGGSHRAQVSVIHSEWARVSQTKAKWKHPRPDGTT